MNEDYRKCSLKEFKEKINGWLDWNMGLVSSLPEFQIRNEDKKLFIKVIEKGANDEINNGENYYMILESIEDEPVIN